VKSSRAPGDGPEVRTRCQPTDGLAVPSGEAVATGVADEVGSADGVALGVALEAGAAQATNSASNARLADERAVTAPR
jgi:hypothetical protein